MEGGGGGVEGGKEDGGWGGMGRGELNGGERVIFINDQSSNHIQPYSIPE